MSSAAHDVLIVDWVWDNARELARCMERNIGVPRPASARAARPNSIDAPLALKGGTSACISRYSALRSEGEGMS